MKATLVKIKDAFIDVLAPKICVVCDKPIENEKYSFVCNRCLCSAEPAPNTKELSDRLFKNFNADDIAISSLFSLYSAKEIDDIKIMKAVHALKYHFMPMVGYELGLELGELLILENAIDFDAIIPLPLHPAKQRERGYNQAEFIANGIAKVINIPVDTSVLRRKNYTVSQTTLSADQRKSNVKNVFVATKKIKLNGKYLLIDDVLTTGSTLNNAAIALINGGAQEVSAASAVAGE